MTRRRSPSKNRNAWLVMFVFVAPLVGCGGDPGDVPKVAAQPTEPASSMGAPELSEAMPSDGMIEPGTYFIPSSAWALADFTITIPDGWTVQYGHVYAKNQDEDAELSLYAVVVDEIYADACGGEGVTRPVGPDPDDLVAALLKQPGPRAHALVKTIVGGYSATRIDLTTPRNLDLKRCRLGEVGLQVWYAAPADKYLVLLADGVTRVYVVDVEGQSQVFVTQERPGTPGSDVAELQSVLESIRIWP